MRWQQHALLVLAIALVAGALVLGFTWTDVPGTSDTYCQGVLHLGSYPISDTCRDSWLHRLLIVAAIAGAGLASGTVGWSRRIWGR